MTLSPDNAVDFTVDDLAVKREGVALFVTGTMDGPQITRCSYVWDGSEFQIDGVAWSARSENIRRSPHVGLVIRDSLESGPLVVYGEAALDVGRDSETVLIRVRPNRIHRLA